VPLPLDGDHPETAMLAVIGRAPLGHPERAAEKALEELGFRGTALPLAAE
jgi:hypothetical protein